MRPARTATDFVGAVREPPAFSTGRIFRRRDNPLWLSIFAGKDRHGGLSLRSVIVRNGRFANRPYGSKDLRPLNDAPAAYGVPGAGLVESARKTPEAPTRKDAPMKAMILKQFGKPLALEEAPEPRIGPRQVLVESKTNGLCATDLKIVDGSVKTAPAPLMLGHENAGVVLETGAEVDSVSPGDRVVVVSKQTCGSCRMCRAGREEMCLNSPGRLGIELDGGFGELVAVSERNLVKVGENVSLEAACLIGGTLGSPLHAIRMARPELGECAVVFGVGGLGLHALQILRHLGTNVVAVDVKEEKLAKARELGAFETINAARTDPVKAVMDVTDGFGADIALEIVGGAAVPLVIQQCLDLLRPGGRLVILGYAFGQRVAIDPAQLVYKWIQVVASHNHTVRDVADAASLVNDGRVRAVITEEAPMPEANEALAALRAGDPVGRIVLKW